MLRQTLVSISKR